MDLKELLMYLYDEDWWIDSRFDNITDMHEVMNIAEESQHAFEMAGFQFEPVLFPPYLCNAVFEAFEWLA